VYSLFLWATIIQIVNTNRETKFISLCSWILTDNFLLSIFLTLTVTVTNIVILGMLQPLKSSSVHLKRLQTNFTPSNLTFSHNLELSSRSVFSYSNICLFLSWRYVFSVSKTSLVFPHRPSQFTKFVTVVYYKVSILSWLFIRFPLTCYWTMDLFAVWAWYPHKQCYILRCVSGLELQETK
jgi:hypothetical protein